MTKYNNSDGPDGMVKFMFSKKATKFDKIFTVDLTLCFKCQFDGEDFVNNRGLLGKHELYVRSIYHLRIFQQLTNQTVG